MGFNVICDFVSLNLFRGKGLVGCTSDFWEFDVFGLAFDGVCDFPVLGHEFSRVSEVARLAVARVRHIIKDVSIYVGDFGRGAV
jgi:hypothetical protein